MVWVSCDSCGVPIDRARPHKKNYCSRECMRKGYKSQSPPSNIFKSKRTVWQCSCGATGRGPLPYYHARRSGKDHVKRNQVGTHDIEYTPVEG